MDSPRGRIDLMRGLRDGKLPLNETVVTHFDRCLGCMACLTACPSGVRYDVLIEETRAHIEKHYSRSLAERLYRGAIFALFPHPDRLKTMLPVLWLVSATGSLLRRSGLEKLLPRRIAELASLAPRVGRRHLTARLPERTPPRGRQRARVALVTGCVQRVFFPEVNEATVRVLSAEGCEVIVPDGQGCCGALSIHAGREEEARRFARDLIAKFEAGSFDSIVVNAAGCGSNLKDYGRIFADDPEWAGRAAALSARVRDVSEFLAALPPVALRHPFPKRVAYHDACHLAHAQRIRGEPRLLLSSIPGLTLIEIPDGEQCCGSAGVYNLIQPESAREIGERKADNVLSTRAELLASANPGCTLQIQKILRGRGVELPAAHPVEILDASISGVGSPSTAIETV